MADTEVSGFTVKTSQVFDDEVPLVDRDSDPTLASKRMALGNLISQEHGEIYVNSGSSTQTLTTQNGWEKVSQFTTNGTARGATNDQTNNKITIGKAGVYDVSFGCSFEGSSSESYELQIRWNGVQQSQITCRRKIGTGGDVGDCGRNGKVDATSASTDIELWARCTSGNSKLLDVKEMNLGCTLISESSGV